MDDEKFLDNIKMQRNLHGAIRNLFVLAVRVIGIESDLAPSSYARDTASASPRALNDPVGLFPSSFMKRFWNSTSRARPFARMSGVHPSPRVTTNRGSWTGRNSW